MTLDLILSLPLHLSLITNPHPRAVSTMSTMARTHMLKVHIRHQGLMASSTRHNKACTMGKVPQEAIMTIAGEEVEGAG